MIVHKEGIEKRNSKLKNLFSLEYHFHKNLSQNRINGVRMIDNEKSVSKL